MELTNSSTIKKYFIRYVSLNVLSMLSLSVYVLADTFFIANGIGSLGLAALNLALPVYSVINALGLMLGMGGATRYAVCRAAGDEAGGNRAFTGAAVTALGTGVLLTVLGTVFTEPLVALLGADEQAGPLAVEYLRSLFAFSVPFLINNVLVCFVRNDGQPRLAMLAMSLGSLFNIVFDYVFVYPLQMGMFGAALATGCAPVLGICISSLLLVRRQNRFHLQSPGASLRELGKTLSVGLPSFVNEVGSGVIMLAFNFTVLGLAGNIGVAAYGIVANLALIAVAVFTGVAQGIQPILSANYGAGKQENIRLVARWGCLTAVGLGALIFLSGLLFPQAIVGAFNSEGNEQLAQIARQGVRIYFSAFLLSGLNIVIVSWLASVLRPGASFAVSFLRGIGAVLPLILLLPRLWGMAGVWLTIPLSELLTLAVAACLLFGKKKNPQGIEAEAKR